MNLVCGDALQYYATWPVPTAIVSDGPYGVGMGKVKTWDPGAKCPPEWYEPHVEAWSKRASNQTTLWFWNTEINWARIHPIIEKHGWRYVSLNSWNKTKAMISGNVNTQTIRHFPIVTEVCAHYVRDVKVAGMPIQAWFNHEWRRTGLPLREANAACGVKNAATRKYLTLCHLWYFPPPDVFERLRAYANEHGNPKGRPYFDIDADAFKQDAKSKRKAHINQYRAKFNCPFGSTNVWDRIPLRDSERVKANGKAVHPNQKPIDLMCKIINASTDVGDVVWEPFGGLFTASLAAHRLGRMPCGAEINRGYYQHGVARFGQ